MEIKELKIKCEDLLNESVSEIKSIRGGDINQTYQIETLQNIYFCKINTSHIGKDLLYKEEIGLRAMQRHCNTPTVIKSAPELLLLSWIQTGKKNNIFWKALGRDLASVHKVTSNKFGFEHHNHIGNLIQQNELKDTWSEFFTSQRLLPQFQIAVDKGLLTINEIPKPEKIASIVNKVCPHELATLIHGDLWSGNIMCDIDSKAYFIDPCISYAHREMDIAMSSLFGKFEDLFYESYHEVHPLAEGWKARLDIYQLYYLLAHLNMFGIGYKNDVLKIVQRYFF